MNQKEIEELLEGMRLSERKLRLARQMSTEAQKNAEKIEQKMAEFTERLEEDDIALELDDEDRLKLSKKVGDV